MEITNNKSEPTNLNSKEQAQSETENHILNETRHVSSIPNKINLQTSKGSDPIVNTPKHISREPIEEVFSLDSDNKTNLKEKKMWKDWCYQQYNRYRKN